MGRERQQGEARMHPVLAPMEVIHVDLLSLGQQANGTEIYVLTMIDRCTRWAEACIVKNTSSETIAKKFLKYWVSRFGVPRKIISDNGGSFQKVFKELAHMIGAQTFYSTVYHPQGNAPIESFHRPLLREIRAQVQSSDLHLNEILQMALLAYRSTYHQGIEETPAYLTFGIDPCFPPQRELEDLLTDVNKERQALFTRLRQDIKAQSIENAEEHMKKSNESRIATKFAVNSLILVRVRKPAYKLQPRWSTPQRVIHIRGKGTVAIVEDLINKNVQEVHIQDAVLLTPPQSRAQLYDWANSLREEAQQPDGDTVLDILTQGSRKRRRTTLEYLATLPIRSGEGNPINTTPRIGISIPLRK